MWINKVKKFHDFKQIFGKNIHLYDHQNAMTIKRKLRRISSESFIHIEWAHLVLFNVHQCKYRWTLVLHAMRIHYANFNARQSVVAHYTLHCDSVYTVYLYIMSCAVLYCMLLMRFCYCYCCYLYRVDIYVFFCFHRLNFFKRLICATKSINLNDDNLWRLNRSQI